MPVVDYRQFVNRDLPLPERGCSSKAVFITRSEAKHLARHGRHSDGTLRPYRCRRCAGWHLGHRRRMS
jgi:hypothetical protein